MQRMISKECTIYDYRAMLEVAPPAWLKALTLYCY